MKPAPIEIQRPQRWDEPFDAAMSPRDVAEMLAREPFSRMDPGAFSPQVPLEGILRNDCRRLDLEAGDIVVREGDYGNSAFLILAGEARVSLKRLPEALLGRREHRPRGWWATVGRAWRTPRHAEVRANPTRAGAEATGTRQQGEQTRVFLHDIPRVLPAHESLRLAEGEVFGEVSALTRSPRSATVVANGPLSLLEIRWQGMRELLKRDPTLRQHVETLYREKSLRAHLRETKVFNGLATELLDQIAAATEFHSYGDLQWNRKYRSTRRQDISERILAEEVIAAEGAAADGLILIRSGFARLSRQHGDGHQTIAYLGKGQVFGLRELAHFWRTGERRPWMLSLRALGYVDVLRVPASLVVEQVLPLLRKEQLPPPLPPQAPAVPAPSGQSVERRLEDREPSMETPLLEFLVDQRFINGTNALMIDLHRCTRCDDCVRACAATHDNNPRFLRQGPVHDSWMVAQACMHCLDPVCMIGCPTGAIGRDEVTGNVTINDQTCIGCSACANSCPYHNIQMVDIVSPRGLPIVDVETGQAISKATKCDLCQEHPAGPACQRACPHDALFRIDVSDPQQVTRLTRQG